MLERGWVLRARTWVFRVGWVAQGVGGEDGGWRQGACADERRRVRVVV